ncbi:hypothetical protein [Mycolicibacterium sp.]|uniref:hypothetical protein n=1 Tax=Mycolicibacterium sp. TaxID=2320850 RepID=UPI0025EF52EC|nr:hypothetical protein [Mycolicibacterium sp.]
MRSVATVFMWLITTVLLAVAVPAAWVQLHLVDRAGYAALAQRAAGDPDLQSAMAGELTAQVGRLSPAADSTVVGPIARLYTASSSFPIQFGQANAFAHRWLFTDTVGSGLDEQGRWVIDFAPMLSDTAFAQTLRDYNVAVPTAVPIPLTDTAPAGVRPGALRDVGMWWPWATIGVGVLAAASALLMLFVATSRGRALAALGVSALMVGGTGWAAIEFAQSYLNRALNGTSGVIRTVADAMVGTAQDSMHQWLNVTLIAGGGLVVVGVIVSLLTGLASPVSGR